MADHATLEWTQPSGLNGVSYSLTREAGTIPDDSFETNGGRTTVTLPNDGAWYFHLRANYPAGWSGTAHFKLQRDSTPPAPFEVGLTRDRGLADPSPILTWSTTDALSGLAGYAVSTNGRPGVPATSPFVVTAEQAGEYRIEVIATDNAGNTQTSDLTFSVEGYAAPTITFISTPLILLEAMTIRGTANAGDQVNIFLDGQLLGSTTAGTSNLALTDGTTVRLPWIFTSDQTFGLGAHRLAATATSPDGQTSLATDPVEFIVNGASIQFNGRPIATFAALPIIGLLLALITTMIALIMTRLWLIVRRLERRETIVDQEIQELRTAVHRGKITDQTIDEALTLIDDDLTGRRRPAKRTVRRRSKRTS